MKLEAQQKDMLLELYGELLGEYESVVDWSMRQAITRKLDAVNELLGFDRVKRGVPLLELVKKVTEQKKGINEKPTT